MQMTRFLVCGAAIVTFSLGTAMALEPAHLKAVEELFELSKTQTNYESSVIGSFEASIANTASQLPEDQKPKFERAMVRVKDLMLSKLGWEAVKKEMMELYAAKFTQAELEAVLPLMRKPEMQAFVAKSGTLAAEAAKLGGSKAQALQPEIMKIVQEEMQK
jgi:hypothetical protein